MIRLLSLLLIALLVQSCKEVGPAVDIDGTSSLAGDTTYLETSIATPQDRVVLSNKFKRRIQVVYSQ